MTPDQRDDQIRARIVQDILMCATAAYWRHRADVFEAARPRPGDYNGQATPDEIAHRDAELARLAQECREHAATCDDDERAMWAAVA